VQTIDCGYIKYINKLKADICCEKNLINSECVIPKNIARGLKKELLISS